MAAIEGGGAKVHELELSGVDCQDRADEELVGRDARLAVRLGLHLGVHLAYA